MARFHLPKNKCKKTLSRRKAAKGSFRWKKQGSKFLLIACPRGKYDAKKKLCRVSTFAVEVVTKAKSKMCPRSFKKA